MLYKTIDIYRIVEKNLYVNGIVASIHRHENNILSENALFVCLFVCYVVLVDESYQVLQF